MCRNRSKKCNAVRWTECVPPDRPGSRRMFTAEAGGCPAEQALPEATRRSRIFRFLSAVRFRSARIVCPLWMEEGAARDVFPCMNSANGRRDVGRPPQPEVAPVCGSGRGGNGTARESLWVYTAGAGIESELHP